MRQSIHHYRMDRHAPLRSLAMTGQHYPELEDYNILYGIKIQTINAQ